MKSCQVQHFGCKYSVCVCDREGVSDGERKGEIYSAECDLWQKDLYISIKFSTIPYSVEEATGG